MQGRGKGRAQVMTRVVPTGTTSSKSSTPRPPNIIWDETCVQELVSWLVTHPTDRHMLYHDHNQAGSSPPLFPNEWPSGRQKKDIYAAIARHIFDCKDPEYSTNQDRYATSVSNRLTADVHILYISLPES
jgi:hypothetical protein